MPIAIGTVQSLGSSAIYASFPIDHIPHNLLISLNVNIPAFTVSNAILEYKSLNELTSYRTVTGTVGPTNVNLQLANGPTISGVIDQSLDSSYPVVGTGQWSSIGSFAEADADKSAAKEIVAPGWVEQAGGRNIISGQFATEGFQRYFDANIKPSTPYFKASLSKIVYTDKEQLTGTHQFTGYIGDKDLKLVLDNGPVISGKLDRPIFPGVKVTGAVTWNDSFVSNAADKAAAAPSAVVDTAPATAPVEAVA